MKNNIWIVSGMIAALLCSCSHGEGQAVESSVTPGQEFLLSRDQVRDLEIKAGKGDLQAAHKLISYYELAESSTEKAIFWQRFAAKRNDVGAMLNLATYLEIEGSKQSCFEALRWIRKASTMATDSRTKKISGQKMQLLISGVDGHGNCVQWLGGTSGDGGN